MKDVQSMTLDELLRLHFPPEPVGWTPPVNRLDGRVCENCGHRATDYEWEYWVSVTNKCPVCQAWMPVDFSEEESDE